jgi:predicted nucleotidyltransferase
MVKKTIPKKVNKEIERYVNVLRKDNLPISKVILFGSYAKGTQKKWSDIDLCIVSPKFKNTYSAMQYLWLKRKIQDVDYAIEPVGFSPTDFSDKYDSLIQEIKKTGIQIKIK